MKKKNFILIAVSIILQLVFLNVPFIGIGETIEIVSLPISIILSLVLFLVGLKGLYKDTNNSDFNAGAVMCIVGICVLAVLTFISPLINGGHYVGTLELYSTIFQNIENESKVIQCYLDFMKSYGCLFFISAIAVYFYAMGLFRFANGLKTQKVEKQHINNLSKSVKKFGVFNCLIFVIGALFFLFCEKYLSFMYSFVNNSNGIPDEYVYKFLLFVVCLLFLMVPAMIVISVFYYINIVKSIIFVFKTPSKIEKEDPEVIDINN